MREVAGPGGPGSVPEPDLVGGVWLEQCGEGADEGSETGHLEAGGGQLAGRPHRAR